MSPAVSSPGMEAVTHRVEAIHQQVRAHPAFAAALQSAARAGGVSGGAGGGAEPAASPAASFAVGAATSATGDSVGGRGAAGGAPPPTAGGQPTWASRLPDAGRRWASEVDAAARRHGVDPTLFAALVWAESNFRADAVSHAGAIGLAQLMPGTAAGLGVDPHDPRANLDGGARYLAQQIERFGDDRLALAAYNAGPGRVARAGGVPQIAETQQYVTRVADYAARLRGGTP